MTPKLRPRKLKSVKAWELGVRFLFGGAITAAVHVLSHFFGAAVAGLFLAFPAILPASLTLVAKHDGRNEASLSALGAILGSVGMVAFGASVWLLAPRIGALSVAVGFVAWLGTSVALWALFLSRLRER